MSINLRKKSFDERFEKNVPLKILFNKKTMRSHYQLLKCKRTYTRKGCCFLNADVKIDCCNFLRVWKCAKIFKKLFALKFWFYLSAFKDQFEICKNKFIDDICRRFLFKTLSTLTFSLLFVSGLFVKLTTNFKCSFCVVFTRELSCLLAAVWKPYRS